MKCSSTCTSLPTLAENELVKEQPHTCIPKSKVTVNSLVHTQQSSIKQAGTSHSQEGQEQQVVTVVPNACMGGKEEDRQFTTQQHLCFPLR